MNTRTKHLIVIAGPTGVGKTEVAIQLAKYFQTDIISADARQFYQEMNIGTAKPSIYQLKEVKHHFINSLSIHDTYDAGKYEDEVLKLLNTLFLTKDRVILCGGSGLYIHTVVHGLDALPASDAYMRKMLEKKWKEDGMEAIQQMLKEHDPEYYSKVDLQNPRRIIRALEVCLSAGKKYSDLRKYNSAERNFQSINIILHLERSVLYEKINSRVDVMMQNGLLEEAGVLHQFRDIQALNTVGYKELFEYLEGKYDLQTAVDNIKQNSRNYAKRQITWFRKYLPAAQYKPTEANKIIEHIQTSAL